MSIETIKFLPWLPALAAVVCGVCCMHKSLRRYAAVVCIAAIAGAFVIAFGVSQNPDVREMSGAAKHDKAAAKHAAEAEGTTEGEAHKQAIPGVTVVGFDWINVGWARAVDPVAGKPMQFKKEADARDYAEAHYTIHDIEKKVDGDGVKWYITRPRVAANFHFLVDPLTIVMLFVVCGIGTLVAVYAGGYMAGDPGYARFFVGVSLFIFAMSVLVMADNLVLLYLGWEGVGLCSYLLIGYYYKKPSAVAAGKKAFIVNRIGDLGFALGIFLTYLNYDTVVISEVLDKAVNHGGGVNPLYDQWIPFLLMLGAFGKSAQIPLYVWLPDAMEGPTPVSALIHAATMVTAGVYMIARLHPVFTLSPWALPTVATIGAATALFAATIALCQYDIKRIYAYSTISQLGYMFLGVGIGFQYAVYGAIFHLFTHAFFKALLFLTSGSVMHALSGQLDLRKMSGLSKKMPITCWLMFIGCLALVAFPFTAGFYSKDAIIAGAFEKAISMDASYYHVLGGVTLLTAVLTAYYTFRLWFRVFMGPERYEMGDEHHGDEDASHADDHHHHGPHEMPWLMNGPLVVLAIGALLAGVVLTGWMKGMMAGSTAALAWTESPHTDWAHSLHLWMKVASGVIAVAGIAVAAYFHWLNRSAADRLAAKWRGLVTILENKYYVDEANDWLLVRPLRVLGEVFYRIDRYIVDGLVNLVGFIPRALGLSVRPMQSGALQGYGLGMIAGLAVIVLLVLAGMG